MLFPAVIEEFYTAFHVLTQTNTLFMGFFGQYPLKLVKMNILIGKLFTFDQNKEVARE